MAMANTGPKGPEAIRLWDPVIFEQGTPVESNKGPYKIQTLPYPNIA